MLFPLAFNYPFGPRGHDSNPQVPRLGPGRGGTGPQGPNPGVLGQKGTAWGPRAWSWHVGPDRGGTRCQGPNPSTWGPAKASWGLILVHGVQIGLQTSPTPLIWPARPKDWAPLTYDYSYPVSYFFLLHFSLFIPSKQTRQKRSHNP